MAIQGKPDIDVSGRLVNEGWIGESMGMEKNQL